MVFVVPANKELNMMLLYLLHMLIQAKRSEWALSQILQDHMAMVCGGAWAVVFFQHPIVWCQRSGGRGGLYIHRTHSLFQNTHSPIHASTKAHYQCHYSSTHDPDIFNPLHGCKVHYHIHTRKQKYYFGQFTPGLVLKTHKHISRKTRGTLETHNESQ